MREDPVRVAVKTSGCLDADRRAGQRPSRPATQSIEFSLREFDERLFCSTIEPTLDPTADGHRHPDRSLTIAATADRLSSTSLFSCKVLSTYGSLTVVAPLPSNTGYFCTELSTSKRRKKGAKPGAVGMMHPLLACSPSSSSSSSSSSSQSSPWNTSLLTKCLLIIQILLTCHSVHVSTSAVVSSYTTNNGTINFTHVAYDPQTDRVYVGASNWLYQFNSSLKMEIALETGPVQDNSMCSPADCSGLEGTAVPHLTTNVNKVLVIDKQSQRLIVCGSVHQGACRRHLLDDISKAEDLIPIPVAANDENSSTFAFIGPARYFGSEVMPVLYVAATNSRLGPYRDMVPAICSRSLGSAARLFTIIEKEFSDNARVDINFHLRDYYLVTYVYGFHASDFVYFATVQKKSHLRALEEWGYVTRLARVCSSDIGYNTYAEVTLQCRGPDGSDYTLLQDATLIRAGNDLARDLDIAYGEKVLVGVFSRSKDHTSRPSAFSAVCVYSLREIEEKFAENIHLCYNGSVITRNMDYIAGNIQNCPEPGKASNAINLCAETLKLNGSIPITTQAAITYRNVTLSAVTAVTVAQHNVIFTGTSSGHLKKLLLSKASLAQEFEDVEVDAGNSVLPDIFVDRSQKYVYVASPYKISKVVIERCHSYNTCRDCLQARNPYCGWCSLEKRCTVKSICYNTTGWGVYDKSTANSRWLSLDTQQCIGFQSIKPERLPINQIATIELAINELPKLPASTHYLCVFGNGPPIPAKVNRKGLLCTTPPLSWRPQIEPGADHVVLDLAVRSTETKTDFLHRPYIFYDCSVHRTCMDCVKSKWNCNWCLEENVCNFNASSCSHSAITPKDNENPMVASSGSPTTATTGSSGSSSSSSTTTTTGSSSSFISGWQYCPSLTQEEEILLPNGVRKEIALVVKNLPNPNDNFQCLLQFEGKEVKVPAKYDGSTKRIICQETTYSYESEASTLQASLTLIWNHETLIDKTNATLYKCHLLGSHAGKADCSLCQTIKRKYQCSWCTGQCTFVKSCKDFPSHSCPKPRIDWIHPLTGPVEGGTLVTIEGSNLGSSLKEIQEKITIGGSPCVPTDYTVSVRIVCRTAASSRGEQSASIVVGNRAGIAIAQEKFLYKMVELHDVSPKLGPKSGGTRLYITGSNFNVGSTIEVYLDELTCEVKKTMIANKQIICRTSAAPSAPLTAHKLKVIIDGATLTMDKPFSYVPDPKVINVFPDKSFISGGRSLVVTGSEFSSIQKPKLCVLKGQSVINDTICTVINDTTMICPSPSVENEVDTIVRDYVRDDPYTNDGLRFRIGFEMDDVQTVRELDRHYPNLDAYISYVPDPKFFNFKNDGIKLYKGESLVIEGENLRLALTEAEVNVTIGSQPCNLTSLTMSQLVCLPPEIQPSDSEHDIPAVVVSIGNNLRYKVGYLRYDMDVAYEVPTVIIALVSGVGAILMVLSLVLLAIFRHKSSQAEREYKRIQLQMDTLENSVRLECKQAFAELQTDLTDLHSDIEASGIPLLDHKTYVMKIFFPGLSENPLSGIYKQLNGNAGCTEQTLLQFEELIYTKTFLLPFINTLENQKSFTIRDKVNVASLLMIILNDRMDYAFDILRELLLKLIDTYAKSKHPQLLLRRTEFVVEKMLVNWMALCMYNYLRIDAGRALFLMFSAIKHQIEKGPIDAITHDARYSLSEERLLREQIDYLSITINVLVEGQNDKFQCRILDCDTISQVKGKILDLIYKNSPHSQRPSVTEVDLEWLEGNNKRIVLNDEDGTTKTIDGWRRLNTLAHYGVRDGAVVCLSVKRNNINASLNGKLASSPSESSHYCNTYYTLGKHSPDNRNRSCDNVRYWHLVRNIDESSSSRKPRDHQSHKAIPEIFLTRLLSSKGTVQKFVDDFFASILTVNEKLPAAVKWLFDLFDQSAVDYGITDPEVLHAWKCNSLPLRFWVNLVKNPDFLFDVEKSPAVDSCLSVIAQAFMDACSTSEHRLGKESPSSKLLFARDMPAYRKMVCKFYRDVADLPRVTDEEMLSIMREMSLYYCGEVDTRNAIRELYVYVARYREEVLETLYSDVNC